MKQKWEKQGSNNPMPQHYACYAFIFRGKINDKFCDFNLDTGSDVTVINPRLVKRKRKTYFFGRKVKISYWGKSSGEI